MVMPIECFGFVGVLEMGLWLEYYGRCLGCYSIMFYGLFGESVILTCLKGLQSCRYEDFFFFFALCMTG